LEFDLGLPDGRLQSPPLEVTDVEVKAQGETAELVVHQRAGEPAATAEVVYRWNSKRERHVAVFEAQQPVGFPGGTTLQFVLRQGIPADHTLGRLRLSATTAKPPLPPPPPSGLRSLVVRGQIPASDSGGLLVISIGMTRDSQPMHVRGPGKYFTVDGNLAGRTVAWKSVAGTDTYPCCWQAWRLPVAASTQAQPFELTIKADFAPDVSLRPQSYFVPGTDTAVSDSTTVR
jgi:hypothetical protein